MANATDAEVIRELVGDVKEALWLAILLVVIYHLGAALRSYLNHKLAIKKMEYLRLLSRDLAARILARETLSEIRAIAELTVLGTETGEPAPPARPAGAAREHERLEKLQRYILYLLVVIALAMMVYYYLTQTRPPA